ncbi:MAG: hypothetical protein IT369_04105 [Candidatus Latescibacteria bacterium]|nr:hypothetical protein [Candidatus Latescibacterota bacterium]
MVDELHQQRLTLQETMNFLGALASGIEAAVGEPAKTISYLAGEKLGMRFSENAEKTDDIEKAMIEVNRILGENQCHWDFEPFQTKGCPNLVQHRENGDEIMLVFRDCMIRQSLFMFGHHQRGSLCNMMFGFFSGALKNIMGRESRLEIVHAGENACYKRLTVQSGAGAAQVAAAALPAAQPT